MLAVHAQLAAFFDAKRQASVLPYVSSNRARQTRLEGAGGVERPTLRVIPHGGRESVRGGGTHPRATELTTSEAISLLLASTVPFSIQDQSAKIRPSPLHLKLQVYGRSTRAAVPASGRADGAVRALRSLQPASKAAPRSRHNPIRSRYMVTSLVASRLLLSRLQFPSWSR